MRTIAILALSTFATLGITETSKAYTVDLTFNLQYPNGGRDPVFGSTDPLLVFNGVTITYDASVAPTVSIPSGLTLNGKTTTHAWYGYSSTGITAFPSIGDKQFSTSSANKMLSPDGGTTAANFWLDTDITNYTNYVTPTRFWFDFEDNPPNPPDFMTLGGFEEEGSTIFLLDGLTNIQDGDFNTERDGIITNFIAEGPDPAHVPSPPATQ